MFELYRLQRLNHQKARRHSLLNGSSSTSSERSKQSLVSAYFGRNRNAHRESASYMPTIFNFQPVIGYHSSALRRRVGRADGTKTSLVGPFEPPNSDIIIQRGLKVFESKKRAHEAVDSGTSNAEESSYGSGLGKSKRRRTSRPLDLSTLGCTNDINGFSFTSLRQLRSGNITSFYPFDNLTSNKTNDQNSKSVQTQIVSESGDDGTGLNTVSTSHIELSQMTTPGSGAALRRKIPYMSPSELEAHLLSAKAVTYTEQYSTNNSVEADDCNLLELDISPVQCVRRKVTARRIGPENDQTVVSVQSASSNSTSPLVNNAIAYDNKETNSSELTVVQPTSLNRFIANLESHSNLSLDSPSKGGLFYRPSGGFDVESRVKRIRELISVQPSSQSHSVLCGLNTHITTSSSASTNYFNPVIQNLVSSNAPTVTSSISMSFTGVSTASCMSFMSAVVCSTPGLVQNVTSVTSTTPSSTNSKLFNFAGLSSTNGVVCTQSDVSKSVAVTSIVSLPVNIGFGFAAASNTSAPPISVTRVATVLATEVTSATFSLPFTTSTQVSVLKEPTTTSVSLPTSTPISFPAFNSVAKFGVNSTPQTTSSAVPSFLCTLPSSTTSTTMMTSMTITTAPTTALVTTSATFSFAFPPASSNSCSLPLQTTSSNSAMTTNITSNVFGSVKPISTFVTGACGLSLFGSSPVTASCASVSLPVAPSVSGFSANGMKPLFTPVSVSQPTTFSNSSFTLGIKLANVTPVTSASLFGTGGQPFGNATTSSNFNFGQLIPNNTSSTISSSGISFGSYSFQFGSFNSTVKSSTPTTSQPFSFASPAPVFSLNKMFTPLPSQPISSFSSLNSSVKPITTTIAFQFGSSTVFSNNSSSTSFSGFNFSQTPTSTPSVINPQANTGFVFGQTGLNTTFNANPFTFGTSKSPSTAPNAPRRRPLSSRRSRRP
ncbi:unnamed protein product [Heterobilharzia americana]|nr:unnamed protein product [Heterobilharzia americana]